ncbi:TetR/AcrR family transcriptional regulator [Sulfitobacter aestuarii]|uniref:TetR/AcrR family transcriptional regulator n=1 Tax=Sulfitobacter aestuarii TaxID=2161676 RepID=A0ABW5TWY7_9RHOB
MRSARLSPDAWLDAGLAALQAQGPKALAAEPLARALGTTKGSFYWHFKDVRSFQTALLSRWQQDTMRNLSQLRASEERADRRLRHFGHRLLSDPIEARLRVWAQDDVVVAAALAEVDAARRDHLTKLLESVGLGNPDFAHALLAALIGLPYLHPGDTSAQSATFDTLIDTILDLSRY